MCPQAQLGRPTRGAPPAAPTRHNSTYSLPRTERHGTGAWQVCTDYGRSFWEEREVILREHAQIAHTVRAAVAAALETARCGRCGLESAAQDTTAAGEPGHAACEDTSRHVITQARAKTSPNKNNASPDDASARTLETSAGSSGGGGAVATARRRREATVQVCVRALPLAPCSRHARLTACTDSRSVGLPRSLTTHRSSKYVEPPRGSWWRPTGAATRLGVWTRPPALHSPWRQPGV